MQTQTNSSPIQPKSNKVMLFFKKLGARISSLFEPEEVEVTFKVEGKKISYTYTKVNHKQVA